MIRPTSLILLALSAAAGGALFHVSYEVSALEEELAQLNRQISDDREAIHVLRAEWSFLNQPARIEELSRRYLDLVPLTGDQFATPDSVPVRLGGDDDETPAEAGAPIHDGPVQEASAPAAAAGDAIVVKVASQPLPQAKPTPPAPAAAIAGSPRRPAPAMGGEDSRTLDDVLREITTEGGQ